jgi:3-oxoadipate enol-lactonase
LPSPAPPSGIARIAGSACWRAIEKMESSGSHAVIDTLDNGYPGRLRGDAQRFAEFRARWLGGDPISYGAIYRMLVGTDIRRKLPRGFDCPAW